VVWYIPPEVQQSVIELRKKMSKRIGTLNHVDIVTWLLEQTCAGVEQLAPLYVSQGTDYCRREIAARENDDAAHDAAQRAAYLSVLEQPEQYSLAQMYAPKKTVKSAAIIAGQHKDIAEFVETLQQIKPDATIQQTQCKLWPIPRSNKKEKSLSRSKSFKKDRSQFTVSESLHYHGWRLTDII